MQRRVKSATGPYCPSTYGPSRYTSGPDPFLPWAELSSPPAIFPNKNKKAPQVLLSFVLPNPRTSLLAVSPALAAAAVSPAAPRRVQRELHNAAASRPLRPGGGCVSRYSPRARSARVGGGAPPRKDGGFPDLHASGEMERWAAANQRASETLAQYGTTRLNVDPVDGSLSHPEPAPYHAEGSTDGKPLSCEEELLMRVFYEQKIQEVCAAFKFPHKIQATAIIYFKRFYLQWSVMEHHPKHIMLTCVYSSCKVEENHVSAEELGKGIQQDHQIILNNEMIVLKSLDFDLIVYAPYRSTEGFIDDMEDFCRAGNGAHERLKDLCQAAIFQIDKMMLTDAPLLYTPGQLALAALHKSNDVHRALNFERYLESVFSRQHSDCPVGQFVQTINTINYMVDQLKIPTLKDMRHIDRKLKHCLDPSSQDEHKKKEKKSKHKSKRSSNDAQHDS